MRISSIAALLLSAVAACASGRKNAGETATSIQTTRVSGTGGTTTLTTVAETRRGVASLPAPVGMVWNALRTSYDSLGIPVTRADETNRVMANEGMRLRRRLGKVPLTRYLDCGSAQAGPNAETYEVHLAVVTQLRPDSANTTIATTAIEASAKPVQFAGEFVACASTGELERSLESMLRYHLAK